MRKLWIIFVFVLPMMSGLPGQNNVALLDTPVRRLQTVRVDAGSDQQLYSFQLNRGLIYLNAAVDEVQGMYILDTGAPGLVLNEEPTAELDGYTAHSCSEEIQVGTRFVNHFALGKRELRSFDAISINLDHLDDTHGQPIAGLIGFELFRDYTLLINYQRLQLHLLNYSVNRAHYQPLAQLPFELDGHLPVVELRVGEQVLRLGVDTGSASNILDQNWLDKLSFWDTGLPNEEVQGLDQQVQQVRAAELSELQLGDLQTNAKFLLMDLSHLTAGGGATLDGLLGYDFLSQYLVAIDYPNQKILLFAAGLEQ